MLLLQIVSAFCVAVVAFAAPTDTSDLASGIEARDVPGALASLSDVRKLMKVYDDEAQLWPSDGSTQGLDNLNGRLYDVKLKIFEIDDQMVKLTSTDAATAEKALQDVLTHDYDTLSQAALRLITKATDKYGHIANLDSYQHIRNVFSYWDYASQAFNNIFLYAPGVYPNAKADYNRVHDKYYSDIHAQIPQS